jgi:hypothetical protein
VKNKLTLIFILLVFTFSACTDKGHTSENPSKDNTPQQNYEALTAVASQYLNKEINNAQFGVELAKYIKEDVVYWSNYRPTNKNLEPFFMKRNGRQSILDRYEYELRNIQSQAETAAPADISTSGNVMYFTQNNTTAFFNGPAVNWKVLTKLTFDGNKISRIEQYLDPAMIERKYGLK